MPRIVFIDAAGGRQTVEGRAGQSVMQAASDALVPGILADCGGACACATCHVHVDPAWLSRLPPPDDGESAMIDCALHVQDNSRLSCQITLVEALDGLTLHLPPSQT